MLQCMYTVTVIYRPKGTTPEAIRSRNPHAYVSSLIRLKYTEELPFAQPGHQLWRAASCVPECACTQGARELLRGSAI